MLLLHTLIMEILSMHPQNYEILCIVIVNGLMTKLTNLHLKE